LVADKRSAKKRVYHKSVIYLLFCVLEDILLFRVRTFGFLLKRIFLEKRAK